MKHKTRKISQMWLMSWSIEVIQASHLLALVSGATEKISWRKEVFPMQWKIALSFMSGYFVFQLFTPVLFHYQGAEVASQFWIYHEFG